MIELAESFEQERLQFKKQMEEQADIYEQKISVIKNEMAEKEKTILELEDQI